MIEERKLSLKQKFSLLLELGRTGHLPEQETQLMLERDRHGRNFFLFSQIGPKIHQLWERAFPTNEEKVLSFKGIVLLERIDEEQGGASTGSTTVTAYICRRIIELSLDSDDLMDFILSNKSTNPYTPFGSVSFSHVKSYDEFKKLQNLQAINRFAHAERQRELIENKKETKRQKQREHHVRTFKRQEQNNQKYDAMISYFKDENNDLISDILNKKLPFPLNLIPDKKMDEISKKVEELDFETVNQLLNIIPKKSPEKLRTFRQKLTLQKTKKIN